MRNLIFISGIIFLSANAPWQYLPAQVLTAKGGSFVLFHEIPDKQASVKITAPKMDRSTYEWPKNDNDFISAYRSAEKIFEGPLTLSDTDLENMWKKLQEMPNLAPCYQFHPTLLLAMGQAAFIPGTEKLSACEISIQRGKNPETTQTLLLRDLLTSATGKAELAKDNESSIHLKYNFPPDSWIKGARVYKKAVGGTDDVEIHPLIYTSTLSDRIEMNIRDTMRVVGEFLYTIYPFDQFGNDYPALQPVYAHNYNSLSAPAITTFKSEVVYGTKAIRLAWDCSIRERVRGFEIYRGMESDGPYQRIASLPASDTLYIDHVESVMRNIFYYVQVIDQMGPGAKSIIHFVTPKVEEKPEAPMDLLASADKKGVRLTWPTNDGLFQTRGYYVYRRDRDTSSWLQVSPFLPLGGATMTYIDSSKALQTQNEYTYVVRAESTSYQLSDPSRTATARPDKPRDVPTPEDLSWRHMDDGRLMLYWSDQRKYDPFILRYHIYATAEHQDSLIEVPGSPIDVNQNFWIQPDSFTSVYGFALQAADAWNNLSALSSVIKPLSIKHHQVPGIILIKPTQKGLLLTWGLPQESSVKSIELYEQNPSGTTSLVKSLSPTTASYEIPTMKDDQAASYFLTYKWTDGTESERGDMVTVYQ